MKKICLFDLDGTLIDPLSSITSAIQYALIDQDIEPPSQTQLKSYIGPPIRDTIRDICPSITEEEVEKFVAKFLEYFVVNGFHEVQLYPGVADMLRQLKDEGFLLAVATGKLTANAKEVTKHLNIAHYFDIVVGCELDGTRSHKNEIIDMVLNSLDPQRQYASVMIGDRKYDIIGANEQNIKSIGVTWGFGSREELEKEAPTLIVDSMEELQRILLGDWNML
ncbi:MAG: HAD hydrolase-like protein [Defluviitaleaceae bacterium]|nr:HAD hydrolase-like protein [Defluviitaleaceae bacterium]